MTPPEANHENKPSKPTIIPTIMMSMSHATNRSPQNATFTVGVIAAPIVTDAGEFSSDVTGVPHFGQYLESAGSSVPQILQYGIFLVLKKKVTAYWYISFFWLFVRFLEAVRL
jgi:hypothetical protein